MVQWATGMTGGRALRNIISRRDLELVGVRVYDDAKNGVDAGVLVGGDPVGVLATTSTEAILDLQPDCVIHMPWAPSLGSTTAEIETLLAAGINVVTTAEHELMHPPTMPSERRDRYERACETGSSTLRAAGLSPGFADELVPILMSGACGSIRSVWVGEYANLAHYESKKINDALGWGKPVGYELPAEFRARCDSAFIPPLRILAQCLGTELDRVDVSLEHAEASETFEIVTGTVPKGTIAGWRFIYEGFSDDALVATIDTIWWLHNEWGTGPDWPSSCEGWDVVIDAEPELRLHWEVGPVDMAESHSPDRMTAAAAHVVNSVRSVCEAPPGIMTLADLGLARGEWIKPQT